MHKQIIKKKLYVDEIKNTCVCVLEFGLVPDTEQESIVLERYSKKCKCADKVPTYLQKFVVRGKAKCSPEDTFNVETGTDIAEFRAELEMTRIFKEVILAILKDMKHQMEVYENKYNKQSLFAATRKSFIEIRSGHDPDESINEDAEPVSLPE